MKQVVIEMSDYAYEAMIGLGYVASDFNMISAIRNGIVLSQNPTNGDIIKTMFHNAKYLDCGDCVSVIFSVNEENWFNADWWNAPYKRKEIK